jgi:hypothetical protein
MPTVPDEEEITLWRAPSAGCTDAALEIVEGYQAERYPGKGVYVASNRLVAEDFRRCYANGMQELHLPRPVFDRLVKAGIIQPDSYFPEGQSWHIPPDGVATFNEAIRLGNANVYHPEAG